MLAIDVDSKENVAEHVNEMPGEITNLDNISLPAEVCGIIAEFLAWDQAFGTLANLNLVNNDIRDETLPVLYETVVFNNMDIFPEIFHCDADASTVPKRFHYTKFAIVHRRDAMYNGISKLPNIALSLFVQDDPQPAYGPRSFFVEDDPPAPTMYELLLHKPLKGRSVFSWTPRIRNEGPPPVYHLNPKPTKCIPLPRLVLERFNIGNSAYLKAEDESDNDKWEMSVAFVNTEVVSLDPVSDTHLVNTFLELSKLRRYMGQWKEWRHKLKHMSPHCHLSLCPSLTQMQMFLAKYPTVLSSHPEILVNVLRFHSQDNDPLDTLADALEELRVILTQRPYNSEAALLYAGLKESDALILHSFSALCLSKSLKISFSATGMQVTVITDYPDDDQSDSHDQDYYDQDYFVLSDDGDNVDHEAMIREDEWPVGNHLKHTIHQCRLWRHETRVVNLIGRRIG